MLIHLHLYVTKTNPQFVNRLKNALKTCPWILKSKFVHLQENDNKLLVEKDCVAMWGYTYTCMHRSLMWSNAIHQSINQSCIFLYWVNTWFSNQWSQLHSHWLWTLHCLWSEWGVEHSLIPAPVISPTAWSYLLSHAIWITLMRHPLLHF